MLLPHHPGKARQLADLITETFPVPKATIDRAVATIAGPGTAELPALPLPLV